MPACAAVGRHLALKMVFGHRRQCVFNSAVAKRGIGEMISLPPFESALGMLPVMTHHRDADSA